MPKTNEIRHHISAVEQTMKITNAMEMVSSNRMRQVMGHIEQNNMYFTNVRRMMREILTSTNDVSHPFFTARPNQHSTFVIITGDKGLCGGHNLNVLNYALDRINETPGAGIITMGHTSDEFFRSKGMMPDINFLGIVQDPTLKRAREVARDLTLLFENGLTDDLRIIFTSFLGSTRGKPVEYHLLPLMLSDYDDVVEAEAPSEILYHPSPQKVLDILVPQYIIGLVFGVMVQAYASEHFARMNAMRSATDNAEDILKNLRIQYNLARQSTITNEITEISGSTEIMKGDAQYEQYQ